MRSKIFFSVLKNGFVFVFFCIFCLNIFSVNCFADNTVAGTSNTNSLLPLELKVVDEQDVAAVDYLLDVEDEILQIEKLVSKKRNLGKEELLVFVDCLEFAKEKHLPIEIAEDKVELSKRKLIKAIRDLFPSLDISYEHNRGFKLIKEDPILGDHQNQRFRTEKWKGALSQPLYRGGALWNKVKEERANLKAAQAEYDKVFLDLTIEVSRAFFNLSKTKTMLSFKENLVVISNDLIGISQEKMNAGLISEIEHLNVQSQQSQLQHDLETAKEDIALALVDMQKVMHLDVNEPVDIVGLDGFYSDLLDEELKKPEAQPIKDEKKQEEKLEVLLEQAYDNRPEFIIQKNKLDAAIYREKAAVAGWMPHLNLQIERGQKAEAYIEDDNNPAWDNEHRIAFDLKWNIAGNTLKYIYDKNRQGTGVEATDTTIGKDGYYDRKNTVSFSILDGLEQFAQTKQAEITHKEAMLELELSEKDIVSEVKEAFYNYNRVLIQLKSVFKKLAYRQKLVDLAKHRSEINEIQISEYIQAEIDFVNERENLYKAMVDYFIAKISLNKAIGLKNNQLAEADQSSPVKA